MNATCSLLRKQRATCKSSNPLQSKQIELLPPLVCICSTRVLTITGTPIRHDYNKETNIFCKLLNISVLDNERNILRRENRTLWQGELIGKDLKLEVIDREIFVKSIDGIQSKEYDLFQEQGRMDVLDEIALFNGTLCYRLVGHNVFV